MINEGGVVTCLDAKNGETVWKNLMRGNFWASPLYADDKIYFINIDGSVSVISAGQTFKLLANNRFDSEFVVSGAVAGSKLILRSMTHLYCFEK